MGYNTNVDELEEGEYFVVGHITITFNSSTFKSDNPRDIRFPLKDLELKTKVNEYNEANYHLLEVAKRMRNYASFFTKKRLPMDFNMSGKRKNMGFPLSPMVLYDGTTGLPMSDGGVYDLSLFISGFGSKDGLKPPHEALQSLEHLEEWSEKIQTQLFVAQKALDSIEVGSRLDMAVNAMGKFFWMNEAEDRLHNCWIALESIAKIDYPDTWIKVNHILKSIRKRLNTSLSKKQLKFFQDYRHKSVHEIPIAEDAYNVHMTAGVLYQLASKALEAELHLRDIMG